MIALLLAALVTVAWDPSPASDQVTGYRVLVWVATCPPTYVCGDLRTPLFQYDVGNVIQAPIDLQPGDSLAVMAYRRVGPFGAETFVSSPSARLGVPSAAPEDPACQRPLGNRSIAIFLTKLAFTGSGGPGSQARLDFQVASPNSPITSLAIAANNVVLRSMRGADVGGLAGMWFTVPSAPGIYSLEVRASNLFGCVATQRGTLSVTVP